MRRSSRAFPQRWPPSFAFASASVVTAIVILSVEIALASEQTIRAVRISDGGQATRILFETDRPATAKVLSDGRHGRLLIELTGVRGPVEPGGGGVGLVKVWSLDEERNGTTFEFVLSRPARVTKEQFFHSPNKGSGRYEYIFEIAPLSASPAIVATRPTNESPIPVQRQASADQLEERQRPGRPRLYPPPILQSNPGAITAPPPEAYPTQDIPIPDRWRLADALGVDARLIDPYNQNVLKADRPIPGTADWFLNLSAISDTVVEPRSFPLPVGVQTTQHGHEDDTFGRAGSFAFNQTVLLGGSLIKGSTAFQPPELELRVAVALNVNYTQVPERRILDIKSSKEPRRTDEFVGLQEAFFDYHIRDVSSRYDFDSVRVGIQPFSTDFRGFLFQDDQLGVRLFGDRDDNRWQYNLAFFSLLEKDTNSGLNDITQRIRNDYVAVANLYRQDLPLPGFTSQVTVVYNGDREAGQLHRDSNGFPVRPALIGDDRARDYDVAYFGYNGDGHFDRINLTVSTYYAYGEDRNSVFTSRPAKISSWFFAAEPSYDWNYLRFRLSGLYASGDDNPYDKTEHGFDAIFEDPVFAGADTSYWIRQSIPFAGGGRAVGLNGRNGVLVDLRSSKEEGQSNFNNPGTGLLGAGADVDLTPEIRLSANLNHLWFVNTAVIEELRQQGSIPNDLGWDGSVAMTWRPLFSQNVVFRASGAVFAPGSGFGDLFTNSDHDSRYYSVLLNAIATF
ncbi:MAG TPA: hypothetical protein VLC74_11485 [Rhizomicrobium sp.]|nr:hypothetical protein [Rhizomicrobium sp.]